VVCVQLLGQFENTGPPPAEKEKISSLPTVYVSQEQAGQRRSSSTHGLAHAYTRLLLDLDGALIPPVCESLASFRAHGSTLVCIRNETLLILCKINYTK